MPSMQRLKRSILLIACGVSLGVSFGLRVSSAAHSQQSQPQTSMPLKGGKFPHAKAGKDNLKGHRDLGCTECHSSVSEPPYNVLGKPSPKVNRVTAFPGHASCVACHNFALMSFAKPAFCGVCHERNAESPDEPGVFARFQTPRTASDFGTAFSHPAHRQVLPNGLTVASATQRTGALAKAQLSNGAAPLCTDCHAPVQSITQNNAQARGATSGPQEYSTESGHVTCFTCHQQRPGNFTPRSGKVFPTPSDCKECHSLSDAGLPKQRAPGLAANFKVTDFKHVEHELDTRSVKKSEARVVKARDYLCAECHQETARAENLNDIRAPGLNACTSCHNDKRRPGLPEPLRAAVLRTLRQ